MDGNAGSISSDNQEGRITGARICEGLLYTIMDISVKQTPQKLVKGDKHTQQHDNECNEDGGVCSSLS